MEDLEKHYLALLTAEEQQLLKHYLSNSQSAHKTILRYKPFVLLLEKPYPVLDILLLQPTNAFVNIKGAIIRTFEGVLKNVAETGATPNFLKLLMQMPDDMLKSALRGQLREQFKQFLENSPLNDQLFLSLLAKGEKEFVLDVLDHLKETQWQYFRKPLGTKEFVLHLALKRMHFINILVKESDNFNCLEDGTLRNNLTILKLVHELSINNQKLEQLSPVELLLESLNLNNFEDNLKSLYVMFHSDIKQLGTLIGHIRKYPSVFSKITVEEVLNAWSPLEIVNKHKLLCNFEEIKTLIDSYHACQPNSTFVALKERELTLLRYFFILSTTCDIITLHGIIPDNIYSEKIQFINNLLRQIKNFELLCNVLDDVLKLMYLRWEHINTDSSTNKHTILKSSSSQSSRTDDDVAAESMTKQLKPRNKNTKSTAEPFKTGFICKSKSFSFIFNFLKTFVTKKLHTADFKQSADETKQQFQNIVDNINDLMWKYVFFEKTKQKQTQKGNYHQIFVDLDCLTNFVNFHIDPSNRESSDEEEHQHAKHCSWHSRRKEANKRRRATFSGSSVATADVEMSQRLCRARTNAGALLKSSAEQMKRLSESNATALLLVEEEERSIVPKLLTSPERMAVLTLSLKQFNETKDIIENFGLHNSQLKQDIQYVEQQEQVKRKLLTIYDNYQQQERQTRNANEPLATVEQIRNVAAKGFEVSKIISVIDSFAQTQHICQPETVKEVIDKHKSNPQYHFLSHFEEANLNAVVICDLILCLPFNRDIITSVLMVIKRHQAIQSSFVDQDSAGKSQLPSTLGPLSFLECLADCMHILHEKSIKDLLCDNIYSLRPDKMVVELQREQIFRNAFYKSSRDLSSCDDLKALIPQFQALNSKYNHFQRLCSYIEQLAKLVRLRDPNCEYHIEKLLKMDPYDVIGDLLFSCDMTPLEIEATALSLNLNLVHVISLNVCPEIVDGISIKERHRRPTERTEATVLNYITNYNRLLACLLQIITNAREAFHEDALEDINFIYLKRLFHMPEIAKLSALYKENIVIAALRSDRISAKSLEKMHNKMDKIELLQLEIGIQDPKALKSKRIDCLILELIQADPKNIYLSSHISDIALRAKLIYEHFTKIASTRLAQELIETTLQHRQAVQCIPQELRQKLEVTLADIKIYAKVSEVMQFETWPQSYNFGLKTPTTIFKHLLEQHLYKLCYEWCCVVKLSINFPQQRKEIMNILLEAFLDMGDDEDEFPSPALNAFEYLLQILETFHTDDCRTFLELNMDRFNSLILLKYSISYLDRNAEAAMKDNLRNYKISIRIFEQLTAGTRRILWNLLRHPLLIVEQLIMNAKFEVLTKVLTSIRQELRRENNQDHLQCSHLCSYCFNKNGYIYDIHTTTLSSPHKACFQFGSRETAPTSTAFLLLNFNLYQQDHVVTNDCIDLLLRIYATKALDYQISDSQSTSEPNSQSTCVSLDSLCGEFQIPTQPPTRSEWIRDEEATHCMCCHRAAFTMLMRRHHCRRCGRVVCYACSTHRMRIPELYEDVEVRVCNDCQSKSEIFKQRNANRDSQSSQHEDVRNKPLPTQHNAEERFKWKLSGNITHDKLLREEFCYEHAPSVALCLSILEYHLDKQKCVELLLFHCKKLEKLIVPNPEVDFELVAKMMNCLALAAKVRGAPAKVDSIQEHSEIILSLVQNGCEELIPPDPFNCHGLRKLADSLVQAERWDLALERHLKCGYATAGVMAAHGLSCLRAGCYDTAREKFSHCMTRLTNEATNKTISEVIFNNDNDSVFGSSSNEQDAILVKRPQNGPPLLQEILKLLESLPFSVTQQETLQRASLIRNSNTSMASLLTRRKEPYVKRMHEPALNILNTLTSLKRVSKGQYTSYINSQSSNNNDPPIQRKQFFRKTCGFSECIYYLLTYGSHADIIQFLMDQNDIAAALKYYILQKLDAEAFINYIYLKMLRKGEVPQLIKSLQKLDDQLLIWRGTLMHTCRYLETQNLLNSLYELQVLLNDPVRAAMTCVKFYTMNCDTFQQQHLNAQHLHNARFHLQSELENVQWVTINFNVAPSTKSQPVADRRSSTPGPTSSDFWGGFQLQMDGRSLNSHINTIINQLEVAKFLSRCELENSDNGNLLTKKILKQIRIDSLKPLPTLFDKNPEKIQICILILLCGKNIDEGFGLAYRIIQHFKLTPMKVYAAATKYLAINQRLLDVEKLINCISSNNGTSTRDIDDILSVAISSAVDVHKPDVKIVLDNLVKKIHSIELRISCHILIGQLKTAYLLANSYERLGDIRKILIKAEATHQVHIKKLCEKKLQMASAQPKQ